MRWGGAGDATLATWQAITRQHYYSPAMISDLFAPSPRSHRRDPMTPRARPRRDDLYGLYLREIRQAIRETLPASLAAIPDDELRDHVSDYHERFMAALAHVKARRLGVVPYRVVTHFHYADVGKGGSLGGGGTEFTESMMPPKAGRRRGRRP